MEYIGPYLQQGVRYFGKAWPLFANPIFSVPWYSLQVLAMSIFGEDQAWFAMLVGFLTLTLQIWAIPLLALFVVCMGIASA